MELFTEGEINLICKHNLCEHSIRYLRIAKADLPCRRKDFGIEFDGVMSRSMYFWLTKKFKGMGLINDPRNTSETMELTPRGKDFIKDIDKGPAYVRYCPKNMEWALNEMIRNGAIKARQMEKMRHYYAKATI